MPIFLSFIFGLITGSFFNVVIIRLDRFYDDLSGGLKDIFRVFGGRSRCPKCKNNLSWRELVPVASFFIQKGKCVKCGLPISWQYPLVELGTGIVFALIVMKYFVV